MNGSLDQLSEHIAALFTRNIAAEQSVYIPSFRWHCSSHCGAEEEVFLHCTRWSRIIDVTLITLTLPHIYMLERVICFNFGYFV
jgi:hypothetical protein